MGQSYSADALLPETLRLMPPSPTKDQIRQRVKNWSATHGSTESLETPRDEDHGNLITRPQQAALLSEGVASLKSLHARDVPEDASMTEPPQALGSNTLGSVTSLQETLSRPSSVYHSAMAVADLGLPVRPLSLKTTMAIARKVLDMMIVGMKHASMLGKDPPTFATMVDVTFVRLFGMDAAQLRMLSFYSSLIVFKSSPLIKSFGEMLGLTQGKPLHFTNHCFEEAQCPPLIAQSPSFAILQITPCNKPLLIAL